MLSLFPLDVLDEIWDLTESVSEKFLTYSLIQMIKHVACKMLCYASCDVGFYTVTYVAWHMRHAKYVVSCRVVSCGSILNALKWGHWIVG